MAGYPLVLILIGGGIVAPAPLYATTRLSLAEAISLAKNHRSDVVQADIDLKLAQLNVLRQQLSYVRLVVQGSFKEQVQDLYMQISPTTPNVCSLLVSSGDSTCNQFEAHEYNADASLQIPIFTGLSLESELSRAKTLQRASKLDRQAKLRALEREVTAAYWGVRRAEMLADVSRDSLKRNQEVASLVKQRLDRGVVSVVDYNRAQTAVLHEKSQLAHLEASVRGAHADLAAALQIEDEVELTDQPMQDASLPGLEDVLARSEARPELKAISLHLEAANLHVRSAMGQLFPQVSLFGDANVTDVTPLGPNAANLANLTAGVSVNWVAFDMLTTWNNVREARYLRDRTAAEAARARFVYRAEAKSAYAHLQKAIEARVALTQALALSEKTVELMRKRYESGTAQLIEVLLAEGEHVQLRSAVTENAVEIADARAHLSQIAGAQGGS